MDLNCHYLKKIAIVTDDGQRERVLSERLTARLREMGVEIAFFDNIKAFAASGRTRQLLWITDQADAAYYLKKQGEYVLVWLNEKNRAKSFDGIRYAFEDPRTLDQEYLERVFRRYAGIPWEILETGRCLLRETTVQDVESFYQIYNDPEITRYMEALYEDPEEERAYIRNYIETVYGFYEFGVWTVIEKESGQIIGRAGLSVREGFEGAELGFVIGKKWQRKGYAFEICSAILRYGREELGIGQIQALVERENMPSICLCQKLGLQEKGEVYAGNEIFFQFT